ncbi:hypothetical protein [Curtobacterium sp. MCPF17_052]|uniref:hypothetical protein n=1 Tax=Curtobacterium sp. MCPF17_052 TaxID=2175655 RepID=UPI0024DF3256|nr:hypothetical protein [Curtobacterium sp. MCPF17_052]WIB12282.1 hypothetical protein DEJ36_16440 [Curtobacterium sp. MCPF17_052]
MESRTVVAVEDDGTTSVFADLSSVESSLVNDLVVDPETGRTYIGAFGYDLYAGEELRPGPPLRHRAGRVVPPGGRGSGLPEQRERPARHPHPGGQ